MTSNIPLAGVIGSPIAHSKSPTLHGHWLKKYQLPGQYIPMEIAPEDLGEALTVLPKLGFRGVNVTIPHKENVFALASKVTARAKAVGAANTLTFLPDGGFEADNTDGYGFIANLQQGAPQWEASSGPAMVLGAGGAARGVIAALFEAGTSEILLTNRTEARAVELAAHFGDAVRVIAWAERASALSSAGTLVNTTSLGMTGQASLDIDLSALSRDALVTDIVYTPLQTDLLQRAADRGCATVDGLGMLLHQAAPGFEYWFGKKPEVDDELRRVVLRG